MTPRTPATAAGRAELRAAISNAYYGARNEGETMEEAADRAADAVVVITAPFRDALAALVAAWDTWNRAEDGEEADKTMGDALAAARRLIEEGAEGWLTR